MDLLTSLDPPLKREVSYNRCTCRRDFRRDIQDVLTVLEVTKKGHIIGPILAISPKPLLLDVPC